MTTDARAAYMNATVATAGPAQLLVMLCERLTLDVQRGLDAMRAGSIADTNRHLVHAQDIVVELQSSLRTDAWEGAASLVSLYDYLQLNLVKANVTKDVALTELTLGLVSELCRTWREAALHSARVA
ncbi:flagellar export chaperone FliS [Nocardioides rubriscoriae]|uniref:flagellar export chaperone FliS n=1 Tax=Nocardioides rubriscoriae TaxID=642762 RepID=UPI0011E0107E|nr:flagellar export chaperone FliS [Nocardioides rubriscoriae]